jgi:hypothetical protein
LIAYISGPYPGPNLGQPETLIQNFDPETWTPRIFIWLPVELSNIKIRKNYPTEAAAVDCALEAARKWIDEGKPELFPEKCDGDTVMQ